MSNSSSQIPRFRRRHAPYHRWPAAEKAALLATFRTSGQSAIAFCHAAGVPLATFAIWQRDARRSAARPVFARVAVATSAGRSEVSRGPRTSPAAGVRAIVRSVAGASITLDGLEASTVRDLVAMLLAVDGRDGGAAR